MIKTKTRGVWVPNKLELKLFKAVSYKCLKGTYMASAECPRRVIGCRSKRKSSQARVGGQQSSLQLYDTEWHGAQISEYKWRRNKAVHWAELSESHTRLSVCSDRADALRLRSDLLGDLSEDP